jgi:hypothetical protein
MAKPCNYKFKGQTYSEAEFKRMLSDGLLDKFVLDDNISIPSVFGKKKVDPNETAADKFRTPVTETAPQAEVTPTKTKEELDKEFNSLNKQYLKDEKLLDEATKNNEDTTEIEARLDETQSKMSEVSSQLEAKQTAPQATTTTEAQTQPTAETKTETTLSKKDQGELDFLDGEIEST